MPGEEPPAAAPFTVNITLSNGNEDTAFAKPVTLTLCKFGLTELPVAVPPIVAVSFQFQDDDSREYLDLSFGTLRIEQISGQNEELAQFYAALSGKKIKPGGAPREEEVTRMMRGARGTRERGGQRGGRGAAARARHRPHFP